jgi:hypothetical protein
MEQPCWMCQNITVTLKVAGRFILFILLCHFLRAVSIMFTHIKIALNFVLCLIYCWIRRRKHLIYVIAVEDNIKYCVSWADCWRWLLNANCWLITRLLVAYSLLLWSLHVYGLTTGFPRWLLTDNCSLAHCWLSKPTLLSRSYGLVREHLVQGFSLSSTQRWLLYCVADGIQQFGLCCLGSFLGSSMPMYLLPLKYAFWL